MQKFILTIVFFLLLVSFLDYPTSLEKLDEARRNEAAFIAPIGHQIRQARLRRQISQPELARMAGLKPSQIEEIEKGNVMPTRDVLMTIQQALGTEMLMDSYH